MEFLLHESPVNHRVIYLDDRGEHFAIVDEIDYAWAVQWKWRVCWSRDHGGKGKRKPYAVRSFRVGGRGGRNVSLFLHKGVLVRSGKMPPTPAHIIGDHQNGQSLDCRRDNLEWATPQQNRENYNGFYAKQIKLAFMTNAPERLRVGPDRKRNGR